MNTYDYDGVQINIKEKDKYGHKKWTLYTCKYCGVQSPAPWNGLPKVGYSLTDYAGREPNRVWYLCSISCIRKFNPNAPIHDYTFTSDSRGHLGQ